MSFGMGMLILFGFGFSGYLIPIFVLVLCIFLLRFLLLLRIYTIQFSRHLVLSVGGGQVLA